VGASDRVVVVGAGFGVWRENQHVASGRWSDVTRMRVVRAPATSPAEMHLMLTLRNATELAIPESLPGFRSFVTAAEAALRGMQPSATWAATPSPSPPEGLVVFERGASRG
jgi:hypothetical protein